jgi:hypothetical protein
MRREHRMEQRLFPARAEGAETVFLVQQPADRIEVFGRVGRRDQPPQARGPALQRGAFQLGDQAFDVGEVQRATFELARKIVAELEHRIEQRRFGRPFMQLLEPRPQLADCLHALSPLERRVTVLTAKCECLRAAASMAASSGTPLFTTQLPPTHSTGSNASHSPALAALIPPVGQKRHWWNGAASAFSAGNPPEVEAGKNLKCVSPRSSPRCHPRWRCPAGGMPAATAALPSRSVRPGRR